MDTFLVCKMIQATPMTAGEASEHCAETCGSEFEEGYLMKDDQCNFKWVPKAQFEAEALPIKDAKTITIDDVVNFTGDIECGKEGDYTTTAKAMQTKSGFDTFATSSCVNPDTYDQLKGNEAASRRIHDKIFGHLGFVLKWAQNGLGRS